MSSECGIPVRTSPYVIVLDNRSSDHVIVHVSFTHQSNELPDGCVWCEPSPVGEHKNELLLHRVWVSVLVLANLCVLETHGGTDADYVMHLVGNTGERPLAHRALDAFLTQIV